MNLGLQGLAGLSALEVAEVLDLESHPEGGYFRETYRATAEVSTIAGLRPVSTGILFLVASDSPSRLHRLASDELWFYHAGVCAELWLLPPKDEGIVAAAASGTRSTVRPIILGPADPYALVPARRWVGARVEPTAGDTAAGWTLVSCVVTPGFQYEDFELGDRATLLRDHPDAWDIIPALT